MKIRGALCLLSFLIVTATCCAGVESKRQTTQAKEQETVWAVLDFEPKSKNLSQAEADSFAQRFRDELSRHVQVMPYPAMLKLLADTSMVRSQYCRSIQCLLDIGDLLGAQVIVKGGVSTKDNESIFMARAIHVDLGIMIRKVIETREGTLEELFAEMPPYLAQRIAEPDTASGSTKKLEDL